MSIIGCKVIAKQALNEESVSITLRIPSASMESYESQEKLKLKAKIVHDTKITALDSSDSRYHYGLEFANISQSDEQYISSLISFYTDIA